MRIIIDLCKFGYLINIKDNDKTIVYGYGNTFEDLIFTVSGYLGNENSQKYGLKITELAKTNLGELRSILLEEIVNNHNTSIL